MTDNDPRDQPDQPSGADRTSLLATILAIVLGVAAQLAIQDGLILLGIIGYIVAAWLFLSSVRTIFDAPPLVIKRAPPEAGAPPTATVAAGAARLPFLRRHWRLVTIAEIVAGDIPPARLVALVERETAAPAAADDLSTQAAHMESWPAADPSVSAPRAVKVTPQGDVLLLDTGLGQVLRYDPQGKLRASYALSALSDVEVLDLDVSPDGQTLYLVDAASNRLQVIRLSDDDGA